MKAVVLSLADPWHAAHGGTIRTRALVSSLVDLGHEVVTVFPSSDPDAHGSGGGATEPPHGVSVVPVRGGTLGARAWPGWVKSVKRTLVPLPTAVGGRSAAVGEALRGLGHVDLLVVSVLPFAGYLTELPGAALWVDHSDLYSDVVAREARRRRGLARVTAGLQHRAVVRTEDALAASAAISTAAGAADADVLTRRTGHPVTWLPTPVTSAAVPREGGEGRTAGFFANFRYWPNVDAWELLRDRWAPALAARGWDVVVAGLGSDTLDAGPHVKVLGPVPTPADFYRHVDVTLAPVRLGGGMKVKVVESLTHGRPVLATSFAVAGFPTGFADAVDVVDVDNPDLSVLDDGPPRLRPSAPGVLEPFGSEGFSRRVAELLLRAPVGADGSGST